MQTNTRPVCVIITNTFILKFEVLGIRLGIGFGTTPGVSNIPSACCVQPLKTLSAACNDLQLDKQTSPINAGK